MSEINELLHAFVFNQALESKASFLKEKIARYESYVKRDMELVASSKNHSTRYAKRMKNHSDKLERARKKLVDIQEALKEL